MRSEKKESRKKDSFEKCIWRMKGNRRQAVWKGNENNKKIWEWIIENKIRCDEDRSGLFPCDAVWVHWIMSEILRDYSNKYNKWKWKGDEGEKIVIPSAE